jgi:hypothetical protein
MAARGLSWNQFAFFAEGRVGTIVNNRTAVDRPGRLGNF